MRKGIVLIILATMLLASCRMPVESQTETSFDIYSANTDSYIVNGKPLVPCNNFAELPVVFPNTERSDTSLGIVVVHWDNGIAQEFSQIFFLVQRIG